MSQSNKMSVMQLTILTAVNMMGSGMQPVFHFSIIRFFHTPFLVPGHTHGTSHQLPAPYIPPAVPE